MKPSRVRKKWYFLLCLLFLLFCTACGPTAESEKAALESYVPESSLGQVVATRGLSAGSDGSRRPRLYLQIGHPATGYTANTVAHFTPDGRHILTGGRDGTIRLWETETGRELHTFRCGDEVTRIAVSRDGRRMVSGDRAFSQNVNVWEIFTGRKIRSFTIDRINAPPVAFCRKDEQVLAGGADGLLRRWDIASGALLREYKATVRGEVSALLVSPDGTRIIAGYKDDAEGAQPPTIRVWDLETGDQMIAFNNQTNWTSGLAMTPDGQQILSGDWERDSVSVWDAATGAPVNSFPTGGTSKIAVSAQGRYALFGGAMHFRLVELATGKEIRKIDKEVHDWVQSIEFSPDGTQALVSDQFPQPKLWDLASGTLVRSLGGYAGRTLAVGIVPAGGRLMTAHGYSNSVSLWDTARGVQLQRINNEAGRLTTSAAVSSDGKKVAFGGWDMAADNAYLAVWDAATARKIAQIHPAERSSSHARAPVFTRDGRQIIWALGAAVIVSDALSGKELKSFRPGPGNIERIALDPAEKYILVREDVQHSKLIALATGDIIKSYKRAQCTFSHDGRKVYALEDISETAAALRETDIATLQEKVLFQVAFESQVPANELFMDNRIEALIAGPNADGLFFYDSYKHSIYKIDLQAAKITKQFQDHTDVITNIGISPDGRVLCSGSHDGTTRLWDPASGREIAQFVSFSDGEWIVITPEGYYNASENGDRFLNVRVGDSVYGIENYREAFFRPDLVTVALAGGSLQGFRQLAEVKPPPAIRIGDLPARIDLESVAVTVHLTDNGGGIGDVRLYVNGTSVALDSRAVQVAAGAASGGELTREYTLKLTNGPNRITAVAFNGDNSAQSNAAAVAVTATYAAVKPALTALVIGIDTFKNPKLTLNYPVADAELFAATLAQAAGGLFSRVDIRKLTTPDATTNAAIIREIESFTSLRPDDLFVFYIASHGTVDDGAYFLITSNVGSLRTEKLKTDAISQDMLKAAIANIPATKKLIVIDTCNAGALGEQIQQALLTRGMSEDTALKILSRAVGSTILSASTSVQEALEGYQGHGLFTYVLAEGLKGGADKGRTGYIRTTELADYVDNEVPLLAEKVFRRAQYPTISISGQAFPIGKVR